MATIGVCVFYASASVGAFFIVIKTSGKYNVFVAQRMRKIKIERSDNYENYQQNNECDFVGVGFFVCDTINNRDVVWRISDE